MMKRTALLITAAAVIAAALSIPRAAVQATGAAAWPLSFAPAITIPTGFSDPTSLAAGDLNHDGILDLVVVDSESGYLDYA